MLVVNIVSLACIGYTDYVCYKIPNVIICAWLATTLHLYINSATPRDHLIKVLFASLLVAGSFIPLRHLVKCNAGDFKLFGMLTVTNGFEDALWIILITLSFSVSLFAGGVKKVPLGFLTFFGYIAFLLFRKEGVL